MKQKKIIIFDVDGVLFDTVDLMHDLTFFEYPTMKFDEARELHSGNIFESLKNTSHKKSDVSEEVHRNYRTGYTEKKFGAPMYLGIKELLLNLKEYYLLVISTSATKENFIPMFDREEITSLFDYFASKEVSKSKVEKFNIILEKYQVSASNTLFITDTLGDVKEAFAVEIPTIAVTWGVHGKEYFLKDEYPNLVAVVDSVSELKNYLNSNKVS